MGSNCSEILAAIEGSVRVERSKEEEWPGRVKYQAGEEMAESIIERCR